MERWKESNWIIGYRGVIEVSDRGMVRRHSYSYEAMHKSGQMITANKPDKVLAQDMTRSGYYQIPFMLNGVRKKIYTHRLVARAFCGGYADGLNVNHKDGNKTNNHYLNLEWVTRGENTKHAWANNLVNLRGERNPGSKLTQKDVSSIRHLRAQGTRVEDIANIFSVSMSTVYKVLQNVRWRDASMVFFPLKSDCL